MGQPGSRRATFSDHRGPGWGPSDLGWLLARLLSLSLCRHKGLGCQSRILTPWYPEHFSWRSPGKSCSAYQYHGQLSLQATLQLFQQVVAALVCKTPRGAGGGVGRREWGCLTAALHSVESFSSLQARKWTSMYSFPGTDFCFTFIYLIVTSVDDVFLIGFNRV